MGQQRREDPTSTGQRGVVALFDNLSVLHHPDVVPVGQPSSWWVTSSVVCSLEAWVRACMTRCSLWASRLAAGSSSSSRRHGTNSARATAIRCAGLPTDARLIAYGGMDPAAAGR